MGIGLGGALKRVGRSIDRAATRGGSWRDVGRDLESGVRQGHDQTIGRGADAVGGYGNLFGIAGAVAGGVYGGPAGAAAGYQLGATVGGMRDARVAEKEQERALAANEAEMRRLEEQQMREQQMLAERERMRRATFGRQGTIRALGEQGGGQAKQLLGA